MAVLAFRSGCAKPDWIQQTLVTADVTGMWRDTDGTVELKLEQYGPKVTGAMLWRGLQQRYRVSGAIEGTVAGDVFRFKQTSGTDTTANGEMTVSGDEMSGRVSSALGAQLQVRLRRLDSSSTRAFAAAVKVQGRNQPGPTPLG